MSPLAVPIGGDGGIAPGMLGMAGGGGGGAGGATPDCGIGGGGGGPDAAGIGGGGGAMVGDVTVDPSFSLSPLAPVPWLDMGRGGPIVPNNILASSLAPPPPPPPPRLSSDSSESPETTAQSCSSSEGRWREARGPPEAAEG